MYLKNLNAAQKELTLDLLVHASMANKQMDEVEKTLIEQYCAEMEIDVRFSAELGEEQAMKQLAEMSDKITLRKVLVELTALVMSDMELDKMEKAFVDKFALLTGLSKNEFKEICYLLEEITRAYQRLDDVINPED